VNTLEKLEALRREILMGHSDSTMAAPGPTVSRQEVIDLLDAIIAEAEGNATYCAYCGARFPLDDEAATLVTEHIYSCVKHPMRDIEKERDEWKRKAEAKAGGWTEATPNAVTIRTAAETEAGVNVVPAASVEAMVHDLDTEEPTQNTGHYPDIVPAKAEPPAKETI
jgi:hypothetical protein